MRGMEWNGFGIAIDPRSGIRFGGIGSEEWNGMVAGNGTHAIVRQENGISGGGKKNTGNQ